MAKLHSVTFQVNGETKEIAVFCDDITKFDEKIDVLTTSAYVNSYAPTPGTVFRTLDGCGISVSQLAQKPAIDLRDACHIWLSEETGRERIKRIGCIELLGRYVLTMSDDEAERAMISAICSYFYMLDIAACYGADVTTVALPLLGGGSQHITGDLLLVPLVNECISFLKRNFSAKNIYFIEKNPEKAMQIAKCLQNSLRFSEPDSQPQQTEKQREVAFISYSSKDKNIADNLCAKLEQNGIKVWYAPRDVQGPYAAAIANAIDKAKYFVVILSQNSIGSEHVLNEVDLAFDNISKGMKFKPLRIDDAIFTPSFKYYLSRQHWMDATVPPLEERLNEFVKELLTNKNQ